VIREGARKITPQQAPSFTHDPRLGYPSRMLEDRGSRASWPGHLIRLCTEMAAGSSLPGRADGEARAAAWVLLRDALTSFLRSQSQLFHRVQTEEIEDLASAKALELILRVESREWSLAGRTESEVVGYLAAVARNALRDLQRRSRRREEVEDPEALVQLAESNRADVAPGGQRPAPPDAGVAAGDFIIALRGCVERLVPRSRRVWLLRVLYDMSSRDIASHPDVGLTEAHINVVVQRARDAIRDCMDGKDMQPHDMPSGTFVELWRCLDEIDRGEADSRKQGAVA
jgi:RNA polymerase sigma factor (sigma-70 family)